MDYEKAYKLAHQALTKIAFLRTNDCQKYVEQADSIAVDALVKLEAMDDPSTPD